MEKQRLYRDGDTQPIPVVTPRSESDLAWGELPPGAPRYYTPSAERSYIGALELPEASWAQEEKMVPGSWRENLSGSMRIGPLAKWGLYIPLIVINALGTLFAIMTLMGASTVSYQNSAVPQDGSSLELARHVSMILAFYLAMNAAFRVVYRDHEVKLPRTPILIALPWVLMVLGVSPFLLP